MTEAAVALCSLDLLDMDDWAYRKSEKAATRDAKRYDVLVFGDSMVKQGVVPRAVEERSGLRVLHLAVSGSQAPASLALLARALAAGAAGGRARRLLPPVAPARPSTQPEPLGERVAPG